MDQAGSRWLLAAALLVTVAALMLVLQWQAGRAAPPETNGTQGTVTLGPEAFVYGPQSWRPYATPLPVDADAPESSWYLAFVPLNGTPVGPGAFTGLGDAVAIHYHASSLSGRMAFAVYGTGRDERGWTNRAVGYGANGYYVAGSELPPGETGGADPLPTGTPVGIRVFTGQDRPESRATLSFLREGGGLDHLHLTRSLVERRGQVTRTSSPEGTFYVTATGGGQVEGAYLLVAVDRAQPLSFQLTMESHATPLGGEAGA
jgi:hypothetical protein